VITEPGALQAVTAGFTRPVAGSAEAVAKTAKALTATLGAAFDPYAGDPSSWGGLRSAAPRFGPWIVLLVMAWLVRTVIASILADRTAGPRRRRWTLL
jgi:hypothetical protein